MVSIYCIEDINGLKYVGSSTIGLRKRINQHKSDKLKKHGITSSKLDLENCIIYELQRCEKSQRNEREEYWINNIECVNKIKCLTTNSILQRKKENNKLHYQNNKEKKRLQHKQWSENNKDKMKQYSKKYCENNRDKILEYKNKSNAYKRSWGGDPRSNNNLLKIDINLFQC